MTDRDVDPFAQFSHRFEKSPEPKPIEPIRRTLAAPHAPVSSDSTSTPHGPLWYWIGSIKTVNDAEEILRHSAKGWYAIAALQGLVWTFLLSHAGGANGVGDVLLLIMAGYLIPAYKSRAFASAILFYAIVVAGMTIGNNLAPRSTGGKNIVLMLILVWVSIRAANATFVYHSEMNTKVLWKNVGIVATITLLVTSSGLILTWFIYTDSTQPYLFSDDELGSYLFAALVTCLGIGCLSLSRRFPLVRANVMKNAAEV